MTRPYTADQCLDFASTLEKDVNDPASRLHGMNFTGEITALRQAAAQARELETVKAQYHELLFHVGTKHPNESRHETALRYIRQAEQSHGEAASQALTANGLTAQETTDGD